MAYPRKKYHTGLTYQYKCQLCHTTVRYTDKILKFKPWYPKGFVYCPICNKPFRHYEEYAIDPESGEYLNPDMAIAFLSQNEECPSGKEKVYYAKSKKSLKAQAKAQESTSLANFCSGCGRKFANDERFCPQCGKVR
jgi:predicted amidophosphoribosyltransferase